MEKHDIYEYYILSDQSGWTWSSGDTSVATVDTNGIVTGVNSGYTTIIATNSTSGQKLKTIINVDQVKIVGGENHFVSLKSDGTVWLWGDNTYGQLGTGDYNTILNPQKAYIDNSGSPITDAIDVACMYNSTIVLRRDGTVWGTGYNGQGQIANGTTLSTKFRKISGVDSIVQISASYGDCYALKSDGTVWCWGYNKYGELGNGTTSIKSTPTIMTNVKNIIQIASGSYHAIMLDMNGEIWSVGDNTYGQFGNGTTTSSIVPAKKTLDSSISIIEIASGNFHTVLLSDTGNVYTAGYNEFGQLGNTNTTNSKNFEIRWYAGANTKHIYARANSTYCIQYKDSNGVGQGVYIAGKNDNGILFNNNINSVNTFTQAQITRDILAIGGNCTYDTDNISTLASNSKVTMSAYVDSNGNIYTVGLNEKGGLGDECRSLRITPQKIGNGKIVSEDRIVNLQNENETISIKCNIINKLNLLNDNYTSDFAYTSLDTSVATVDTEGKITAVSMGTTEVRIHDNVNDIDSMVIVKVNGEGNITQPKVVAGTSHFAALKSDGTLFVWGNNNYGQLGTGNTTAISKPTLALINNVKVIDAVDIACAERTTYILKSDGTVWCTGYNNYGQLSNGGTTSSNTFNKISNLSNIVQISACYRSFYALKSDGTVWSCGYNGYGQLGNGTTANNYNAKQMNLVSNVVQISAGNATCAMLDADGSVWFVGDNSSGEYGNGVKNSLYEPIKIKIANSKVKEVELGGYHTIFLMDDGKVYSTGYNAYGQFGYGSISDAVITPRLISNVTDVKHIYTSANSTYITRKKTLAGENQGMYVTGENQYGILFNDSTSNNTIFSLCQTDKDILYIAVTVEDDGEQVTSAKTAALVDSNGHLYTVGLNDNYQMGDQTLVNKITATLIGGEKLRTTERIINIDKIGDTNKVECYYNIELNLLYNELPVSNKTYTSLDTSIATVDIQGIVTGKSKGSTVIRIFDSKDNSYISVIVKVLDEGNIAQPKIVGGENHYISLKANGTAWIWGSNYYGQLGNGTTLNVLEPQQVSILNESNEIVQEQISDIIDVAAGTCSTYILRSDGSVWATGLNDNGQLGIGDANNSSIFKHVLGLNNIIQISAKGSGMFALKNDGTVWSCGYNRNGQLGDGTTTNRSSPVMVKNVNNIIQISASNTHLMMLDADGSVWACGDNSEGQLGINSTTNSSVPVQMYNTDGKTIVSGIKEVSAGFHQSILVGVNGKVYSVGANGNGQLGTNDTTNSNIIKEMLNITDAQHAYAGISRNVFVTTNDNGMYVCGYNGNGQLFTGDKVNILSPIRVLADKKIISVDTTTYTTSVVDENGDIYSVGEGKYGLIKTNADFNTLVPYRTTEYNVKNDVKTITIAKSGDTKQLNPYIKIGLNLVKNPQIDSIYTYSSLDNNIAVVTPQGLIIAQNIGNTLIKIYNAQIDSYEIVKVNVLGEGNVAQSKIAAGNNHFVALKANGSVWTWGKNDCGQLGLKNTIDMFVPQQTEIIGAIDVACAGNTSFVLKQDGTVWGAGYNYNGQLADSTSKSSNVFKKIQGLNDIVQITAYNLNCYALDLEGNVWTWGSNSNGQLGTTLTSLPSKMIGVSNILQIASGNNFLIMLDSDGCVWGVGNNSYGQFGNGTTTASSVPVKINNNLGRIKEIAVGGYHTVMLLENGDIYQCGYNGDGQLGNGTTTLSNVPIKIEEIQNIKHIYAAENGTYISKSDKGMYIMGNNNNAQLYTGDTINTNIPEYVQSDKDIYMIAVTTSGTGALVTENGEIYTIGYSGYGEIGDGLTSLSLEPVNISNSMLEIDKIRVILNLESENSSHSINVATKTGFNLKTDLIENEKINFVSLDSNIATVTPNGIITAQKCGQTEIEVVGNKSGLKTKVSVEVLNKNDTATPKIVSENNYTIALRVDGTVWSYGCNSDGQLGLGDFDDRYKPTKLDVQNIIDIAVGSKHALLLSKNGKIYSFGLNNYGQLGRTGISNIPEQIPELEDIVRIEAGENSSMALSRTGKVYTWGSNNYGQLGNGKTSNCSTPQEIRSYGITKISMGGNSTAGIDSNNDLYTWGYNDKGQLGKGNTQIIYTPTRLTNMSNIKDIKLGNNNSVALDNDGHVWTTGVAENLGDNSTQNRTVFSKVVSETDNSKDLEDIEKIRLSDDSVVAVKNDETAVVWGANTSKQFATETIGTVKTPYILKVAVNKNIVNNIFDITVGNGTVSFVNKDGEVWTNGKNDHGQLGNKTSADTSEFQCISGVNIECKNNPIVLNGINDISCIEAKVTQEFNLLNEEIQNYDLKYTSLDSEIVTVTENTGIVTAVSKGKTQIQVKDAVSGKENSVQVYVLGDGDITTPQIESNSFSNIALKSNGEVWGYGYNANGELGTGDNINKNIPTYTGINNIMQVSLGNSHCLAVDIQGHVWSWGNNSNGQLGVGEGIDSSNIKMQVKSTDGQGVLEHIIAVAAGNNFSMALDSDGNVYTWGCNEYGQLGLNDKIQRNLPTKVIGLENIIGVYAKNSSSFVIDVSNKLWSCGYNGKANLGLNNYTNQSVFRKITTIDNVKSVIANETNTTYVITKDGVVYGFGNNVNSSLLNATGIVPQSLSALCNLLQGTSKLGAGNCTGYAITTDSKVVGWGLNNYSQLCYEDTKTQSQPIYLKDIEGNDFEDAMLVSGNNGSVQVVKNDGTVWSAGYNEYGELGDSTNQSKKALENISPNYIKVNKNEVTLKLSNPQYELNSKLAYGFNLLYELDDTQELLYESSNDEVASINEDGVITAHRLGRTYITIKTLDSKYSKRITVDVIGEEKITKEKVIAGKGTTIALKQDGTVWTLGTNNYGQMGNGRVSNQSIDEPTKIEKCKYLQTSEIVNEDGTLMVTTAEVEQEFKNVVDIAAGELYNLAVDNNGFVWAWGDNTNGQLGDGTNNSHYVPFRIENLNNIVKVEADINKSYALTSNGEIYVWGYGYGNKPQKLSFGKKVQKLTKKSMLCEDGTVFTLTKNPIKITGFNNVIQIASNGNNYAALDLDGKVWTLGNNTYGQLGVGDTNAYNIPVQVKIDNKIKEIKYGTGMLELLDVDGNLYTCGVNVTYSVSWHGISKENDLGRLGTGVSDLYTTDIMKVENAKMIKTIDSQYSNSVVSDKNGIVYTTGDNQYKQLGDKISDPYRLEFQSVKSQYVYVNNKNITVELNETKQVKATLNYTLNLIDDVIDANNIEYTSLNEDIVSVTSKGLILGKNVGTAEVIAKHTITGESAVIFVRVTSNESVAVPKVVQGSNHTIALKSDGTVWGWGNNSSGQLGIGNKETQIFPVKNPLLENVIDITAGPDYTIVLKSDGTVWSFGNNVNGVLGNPEYSDSSIPVQVITKEGIALNKIVKISANQYRISALDENGKVWNWGYGYKSFATRKEEFDKIIDVSSNYIVNANGDVTVLDSKTKLNVSNVIRVSEGSNHALFLTIDGRGYAYGSNEKGQLGTGNTVYTNVPKPILDSTGKSTLTGIKQLNAGKENSIAVLDNNDTYIWGSHENYKLCSEQTTNQVLPSKINNIEPAISCFIGENNAGIIDIKGFVYDWGLGIYGNIGDSSYKSSSTPVLVGKKEIELNTNNIILHENEEYQLNASNGTFNVLREIVEEMEVSYLSGNTNIATVTDQGKVKAVNTGKVTIVANKVNTQFNNIVNVTVLPTDVDIEPMIVTAGSHTIILKADGTVWAYGDNSMYVLGNGTSNSSDKPVMVVFNSDDPQKQIKIKHVATGNNHVLAVDTEGNVWGWGTNTNNSLGFTSKVPTKMNLNNIEKVIANNNQSMAITNDGFVFVWGQNTNGELGLGTYQSVKVPTLVSYVSDVMDGTIGNNHSVLLTKSGKVLTTGQNVYGQTGKSYGKSNMFEEINTSEIISKVSAGDNHTVLLSYNSNVFTFGYNNNGQLGNETTQNMFNPTQVIGGIMDISAGKDYTMILTHDKKIYSTGSNECGELGNGKSNKTIFTKVDNISNVMNFDCGNTYSAAITYDGNVYGWGDYYHGIQKIKTRTNSTSPLKISNDSSYTQTPEITVNINDVQQIKMVDSYVFNVFEENNVTSSYIYESINEDIATVDQIGKVKGVSVGTTWIKVIDQSTNKISVTIVKVIEEQSKVAPMVEGGDGYTVVLKSSGDIWSYGYNKDGQLGLDSNVSTNVPNQINILTSYKKVMAGEKFAIALRNDGTVWAWGDNTYGQLGQGNRTSALKPIQVQNLKSIIDIAVGSNHVIALDSAGNIYAWGLNSSGQLGTGDTNTISIPTKVIGITNNILSISAGENTTAVVDEIGDVYVFGSNENELIGKFEYEYDKYGQKILPAINNNYIKPQKIYGVSNAVKIQCMNNGILILDSNKEVDQITKYGSQSILDFTPIAENMVDVTARKQNIMLLDKDGKAYSYGNNSKGQAGVGTNTLNVGLTLINILDPISNVNVGNLENDANNVGISNLLNYKNIVGSEESEIIENNTNVAKYVGIGCGNENNYVIGENGYVYCAGSNEYGQIGNGTYEDSSTFTITSDKTFNITPEIKIMEQPETETLNIGGYIFNVYNNNNMHELSNYEFETDSPEIVSVENGLLSAENTGKATITVTNKITGATKSILRVVQPLDEDRIETIVINENSAKLTGLKTYSVDVIPDENEKGNLVITTKNNTDTIEIDGTTSVGTIIKEILLDTQEKQITVKVTASNGNSVEYTLNVNVLSQDTSLNTIKIGDIEATAIGPTSYEIIIENTVDKPEVTAIATSDKAQVIIESGMQEKVQSTKLINMTGKIKKVIPIIVLAESGDRKIYELTIYKEDGLTALDTLTINGVHAMKMDENTYKTIIKNDVEIAQIVATTLYQTAQIHIDENAQEIHTTTKAVQITEDETLVKINVSANNVDREITLLITKEKELSKLRLLKVTANTVELPQMGGVYTAQVNANVTNVEIVVTTENETDLVSIGEQEASVNIATGLINVPVGESATSVITVIDAENETNTRQYKVNIKRPNSDTSLKSISVQNEEINKEAVFENGTNNYRVGISEVYNKINITAIANNELSKVSINGSDFELDSETVEIEIIDNPTEVLIQVVAADKSVQEYKLLIKRQSKDATLNKITVEGNEVIISEKYEGGYDAVYECSLEEEKDIIIVNAIANNENAYIKIDSNKNEKYETTKQINMIGKTVNSVIGVTAEDGTIKEYKLIIYSLSNNTNIKTVKLNGQELEVVPSNKYVGRVNKNSDSFELYISAEDSKAKIKIDDNEPVVGSIYITIPKNESSKTVNVKIISQNGTEENYIVSVTNQSDDCDILSVKVDNEYAQLDEQGKYCINVVGSVEAIDVGIIPSSECAKVEINGVVSKNANVTLQNRINNINVKIIAEDGTSKDYELVVTKLSNEIGASIYVVYPNENVDGDEVTEEIYSIELDENGKGRIKINEFDETLIRVITVDEKARIEISGNESVVSTKNVVVSTTEQITNLPIRIVAEDGTIKQYEIELIRNLKVNQLLKLSIDGVDDTDIIKTGDNIYTALIPDSMTNANISVLGSDLTKIQIGANEYSISNNAIAVVPVTSEEQVVTINVKAESGDINTYELKLMRVTDLSLNSIKIDDIDTVKEDGMYRGFINDTTESVIVKISPLNEQVLISTKLNDGEYTEKISNSVHTIDVPITGNVTTVYIRVEDYNDNSRVKDYVLNIQKESSNSEIANVEVNGKNIVREDDTFNLELSMNTTTVDVKAIASDKYAGVKISEANLNIGISELNVELGTQKTVIIPIIITSQNGKSISTYNLVINRKSEDTGCDILFNSAEADVIETDLETNVKTYVKYISNTTTSVSLKVTTNDSESMIDILGESIARTLTRTITTTEEETRLVMDVVAENGNKQTFIILVLKNSSDATLQTVKVNNNLVDKDENGIYVVNVIEDENETDQTVDIEAITTNRRANVKIDTDEFTQNTVIATKDLAIENKLTNFQITVQPQDLTVSTTTYTLKINKISANNKVKFVKSGEDYIVDYDNDTYTYNYYVSNDINELPITIETENEFASIVYGENENAVTSINIMNIPSVNIGTDSSRTVSFKVVSESGIEQQYNINILRYSNNTEISKIYVDNIDVTNNFSNDNCVILINKDVTESVIRVISNNKYSTIKIGDNEVGIADVTRTARIGLDEKTLIVPIVITAQDEVTQKQYNIVINRKSDNTMIQSVELDGQILTPLADGNYETTVKYSKNISEIKVTTEYGLAEVTLNGQTEINGISTNVMLNKNSDTIKNILITAHDGTTKTYTLTIHKTPDELGIQSITVNNELVTEVDKDGTYKIIVPIGTVDAVIEAKATVSTSKIKISDSTFTVGIVQNVKQLTEDYNTVNIVVENSEGTQSSYKLIIQKMEATLSSDTTCEILVNGEITELNDEEHAIYTKYVNCSDDKAIIKVTATNENAKVTIEDKQGTYTLEKEVDLIGEVTEQQVVITSERGVEKTYTIKLARKSTNADIEAVIVNNKVLDKDENGVYRIDVLSDKQSIQNVPIKIITVDGYASIRISTSSSWYQHILECGVVLDDVNRNIELNIFVQAQDPGEIPVMEKLVIRRVSDDTEIKNVKVNGEICEEYDSTTKTYTKFIERDITDALVEVTTVDDTAAVTIGNKIGSSLLITNLENELLETQIMVTTQTGIVETYTLKIIRKSLNTNLEELRINNIIIDPDEQGNYIVNIPDDNTASQLVEIKAKTEEQHAEVQIGDGNQWYTNIGIGNVKFIGVTRKIIININICSHSGEISTKLLEINRVSSDITVKNIKVNNELVTEYNANTHTYKMQVKSNVNEATIVVETSNIYTKIIEDGKENTAIATLGIINMENNQTVSRIFKLVAEDGTQQEYTLIIEKMSSDCDLSHLYLDNEDIIEKFVDVESVPTANVSIEKLKKLMKIEVESNSIYSSIHIGDTQEGLGYILRTLELDLNVNSIIVPIVITSQDGIYVKTYNIIFTRLSNDTKITTLKVDGKTVIPDNDGNYETSVRASRIEAEVNILLSDNRATVEFESIRQNGQLIKTISFEDQLEIVKEIKIIAQDGTERIITLTIHKSVNNLNLEKVYVDNRIAKQISYNTYEIDVKSDVTKVKVLAIAEKDTEYVSINNNDRTIAQNQNIDCDVNGTIIKINTIALYEENEIDEQCEYNLIINKILDTDILEDLIPTVKVDNQIVKMNSDGKYYKFVDVNSDNAVVKVESNSETTQVKLKTNEIETEYTYTSIEKNIGLLEDITIVTVKAKNGAGIEQEYTLYIIKKTSQNISTELEYLKYNGNSLESDENGLYEVVIGMNDTSVDLEAKSISEFSIVEIAENAGPLTEQVIGEDGNPITNISRATVNMENTIEKPILITVKSVLGDQKSYIVKVIKVEELKLKSITVNSRLVSQENDTNYTIDVLKGTTKINISAILYNHLEYIRIAENDATQGSNTYLEYDLSKGNIITLVASSSLSSSDESYEEKTYSLTITEVERVNELSDLQLIVKVDGNEIEQTDDGIYIAQVSNEIDNVQVKVLANSYSTKVKIGNSDYSTRLAEANIDLTSKEVDVIVIAENADDHTVEKELWIVKQFTPEEDAGLLELKANNNIVIPQSDGTYVIRTLSTSNELLLEATTIQKLAFVSINGNTATRGTSNTLIGLNDSVLTTSKVKIESVSGVIKEYTVIIDKSTHVTGKVITEAVDNTKQNATIVVYRTEDGRVENDSITPREIILEDTIESNGDYILRLTPGLYDIVIRKTSCLECRVIGVEVLEEKDLEIEDIRLYAGDSDGSGEIEISDLAKFNDYFINRTKESNRLHEEILKYDFDENGVVNTIDRNILKANYGKKAERIIWRKPDKFIIPISCDYTVTSEYGLRTNPISGEQDSMHTGIDISGIWHTRVYAVADGEVTFAGVKGGYGNCIEIRHTIDGETMYTLYAHLSRIDVQVGDIVVQSQIIGLEGGAETDPNHGDSTGHHLHFEIKDASNQSINPRTYIEF